MEPHILVNYASRSRPKRFKEGLESILGLMAHRDDFTILAVIDANDPELLQYSDIILESKMPGHWIQSVGVSKSKIDAINRKPPAWLKWDILVNFSDDMKFVVYGWDHLIREGVRCNGPDVFLHYPDSTARNMLPTMSVLDRVYFERDNFIYYPEYWSVFPDNEAMEVAKMRGRYFYLGTQIYDHYHPAYGHVPWDRQYEMQQAMWGHDEALYNHRKANKFFLDEHGKYSFVNHSYPDNQGTPAEAGQAG